MTATIHRHEDDLPLDPSGKRHAGKLVDESHGAVQGFCIGITYYDQESYGPPGVHEDQEGFYVLEGTGTARVGDQEFRVRPGLGFLAAKGVPHSLKKDPGTAHVKVLWCHGAV